MKKFFVVFFIIFFSVQKVYAINYPYQSYLPENSKEMKLARELTDKLDTLYEKGDHNQVFYETNSAIAKDYFSLTITAEWLRYTLPGGDARYNYHYASSLFSLATPKDMPEKIRKSLQKKAITSLMAGKIMIFIDGARCKDKDIPYSAIFYKIEKGMADRANLYWKTLSRDEKDKIIDDAMEFEEAVKKRKPQNWICIRSGENMTRYFDTDPNCEKCTIRKGEMGIEYIMPDTNIEPEYIEDAEWNKKRIEILNMMKSKKK